MIRSSSDIIGPTQHQNYDVVLTSSDSEFVPHSQGSCCEKPVVKDKLKIFRNRIITANAFVLDTVSSTQFNVY